MNRGAEQFFTQDWCSLALHTSRLKKAFDCEEINIDCHTTLHGVVATAIVMIPFYIGLWIVEIGGLSGMMDDG